MEVQEIEEAVKKFPLSLLTVKNKNILKIINDYLPFSVGIEIECDNKNTFNINNFKNIENILDVNCSFSEKRFRIPKGLNGLICLFNITKTLKKECLLNPLSGIHYHIDMTDTFDKINQEIIENFKEYILKELDSWNYIGTYNKRDVLLDVRCWVRFDSSKKTCEFRIGEMTFDYELIFKRILHCSQIVKFIKDNLDINKKIVKISLLQQNLENLKDKSLEPPLNITENRVIKLENYGRK
jgi:hypothetical protein